MWGRGGGARGRAGGLQEGRAEENLRIRRERGRRQLGDGGPAGAGIRGVRAALLLHLGAVLPVLRVLSARAVPAAPPAERSEVFVGGSVQYAFTTIPTYPRCGTVSGTALVLHKYCIGTASVYCCVLHCTSWLSASPSLAAGWQRPACQLHACCARMERCSTELPQHLCFRGTSAGTHP